MLILLSPAKTLDMDTPTLVGRHSQPAHLDESERLVKTLRNKSAKALGAMMSISPSLATLNRDRFRAWQPPFDADNARPAIEAFRGDVYAGFDVDTLDETDLDFAQDHLRILSGLYGLLRPYDLMQAYRLEMGTRLKTRRGESLYDWWGSRLTDSIDEKLAAVTSPLVINCASNEYSKAVDLGALNAPVVSPVFHDEKNGEYKMISFFAKKARGAMARHLVRERAVTMEAVMDFDGLGYTYSRQGSKEGAPMFRRSEKIAAREAA